MDILGIGVPELVFIVLIAIIVLGPKDMQKAGKTIGSWLRKIVMSDEWQNIKNASRNVKNLPTQLMREAGFEEEELRNFEQYRNKNIKVTLPNEPYGAWSGQTRPASENRIAPPVKTETHVEEEPAPATEADASLPPTSLNKPAPTETNNA